MAKLNLEELVARATQSEHDKLRVKYLKIDAEGNTIQAVKKDIRVVSKVLDMEQETTEDRFKSEMKLVYDHCAVLHEAQLQAVYQCVEPIDVVEKVFDSNVGLIHEAALEILGMYGLADEDNENPVEAVKN